MYQMMDGLIYLHLRAYMYAASSRPLACETSSERPAQTLWFHDMTKLTSNAGLPQCHAYA